MSRIIYEEIPLEDYIRELQDAKKAYTAYGRLYNVGDYTPQTKESSKTTSTSETQTVPATDGVADADGDKSELDSVDEPSEVNLNVVNTPLNLTPEQLNTFIPYISKINNYKVGDVVEVLKQNNIPFQLKLFSKDDNKAAKYRKMPKYRFFIESNPDPETGTLNIIYSNISGRSHTSIEFKTKLEVIAKIDTFLNRMFLRGVLGEDSRTPATNSEIKRYNDIIQSLKDATPTTVYP